MIDAGDYDDYDDYDPDDDRDEDPGSYIPDEADYEWVRAYEEHAEHCETVHGGGDCDCRPTVLERLRWWLRDTVRRGRNARARIAAAARRPWTVRLGPAEITVRLHRQCGACAGRGWFYSAGTADPVPMPKGYDGVSLCGCGTAITRLADARRAGRQARKEPPF